MFFSFLLLSFVFCSAVTPHQSRTQLWSLGCINRLSQNITQPLHNLYTAERISNMVINSFVFVGYSSNKYTEKTVVRKSSKGSCSLFLFTSEHWICGLIITEQCQMAIILFAQGFSVWKGKQWWIFKVPSSRKRCQDRVRCLHKVSPKLFHCLRSRSHKKAHQRTEGWHVDLRPTPPGRNHFSQL